MKKYHMYLEYEYEGPSIGCIEYDDTKFDDASVDESIKFFYEYVHKNRDLSYCITMLDWVLRYANTYDVTDTMYDAIDKIKAIFEERIQYILQNTYEDVEFIGIKDDEGNFSFR
ncbi:MAG: hypothetical protein MJZ34_13940 [Paludibacteraceae bacterium]|nr:hypothetical protein [Paludibacteraceae bacterium]